MHLLYLLDLPTPLLLELPVVEAEASAPEAGDPEFVCFTVVEVELHVEVHQELVADHQFIPLVSHELWLKCDLWIILLERC